MPTIVPASDFEIRRAARLLRAGRLAAFPTETVYGLGANALDSAAVARIFEAKGRPATNPIIVHIAQMGQIDQIAVVSEVAVCLAEKFWPGPLTMVLPRTDAIPDIVTAGGPTVGVRMPRHPVARRLIEAAQLPIAAPSANRSESISPTRAEHVADSLGDNVDLILDGGSCDVGIESTVLDLSGETPRILRPGMIDSAQLEAVIGSEVGGPSQPDGIARSPGQRPRHYAPSHPTIVAPLQAIVDGCNPAETSRVYLVYSAAAISAVTEATSIALPATAAGYAAGLYDALHRLDHAAETGVIVVEAPPEGIAWAGICDRLKRASSPA